MLPHSGSRLPRSRNDAFDAVSLSHREIAKRVKKTRDESFQQKAGETTVNRTEAIACLGGAALDNEECYLLSKFARAMGVCYLEHQARI